jgi:hypothetical protein
MLLEEIWLLIHHSIAQEQLLSMQRLLMIHPDVLV